MEVGLLVGDDLHRDRPIAQAVVTHDLHRALERLARRLVVMEKVPRKEHHVDLPRETVYAVGRGARACMCGAHTLRVRGRHACVHRRVRVDTSSACVAVACLLLESDLEDLGERPVRVLTPDGVLLTVAEVDVRGDQDVEDVRAAVASTRARGGRGHRRRGCDSTPRARRDLAPGAEAAERV